jgi:hypothetical protein
MARISLAVLLFALAIVASAFQAGIVQATARGGFEFSKNGGKGASTISGTLRLGAKPVVDLMFVAKNDLGVTLDGHEEAVILMTAVTKSAVKSNQIVITGTGTFQGEGRMIEITLIDAVRRGDSDAVRVRVLNNGFVEFDQSSKLQTGAITFKRL